jgi:hypothetical protein
MRNIESTGYMSLALSQSHIDEDRCLLALDLLEDQPTEVPASIAQRIVVNSSFGFFKNLRAEAVVLACL